MAKKKLKVTAGDRVYHPLFGEGEVVQVLHYDMRNWLDLTIEVLFDIGKVKWFAEDGRYVFDGDDKLEVLR